MNALGPWAPVGISHVAMPAGLAMMRVDRTTLGRGSGSGSGLARQLGLQLELQKVTEPAIKCDAHAYNIATKMLTKSGDEAAAPLQMRATIPAD